MFLKSNRSKDYRLKLIFVTIMGLTAAYLWGNYYQQLKPVKPVLADDIIAIMVQPAQKISQLKLYNQQAKLVTSKDLTNFWSLLIVGDPNKQTHELLSKGIQVHNNLTDPLLRQQLRFVLVAESPNTTAQQMDEYLPHFDHLFIGLTGGNEALSSFKAELGYQETSLNQLPMIYLIDPKARLNALFSSADKVSDIATSLEAIMNFYQQSL